MGAVSFVKCPYEQLLVKHCQKGRLSNEIPTESDLGLVLFFFFTLDQADRTQMIPIKFQ